MKIVLCCAGGFSTTMLMDSMKNTVKNSAKLDEKDIADNVLQILKYGIKRKEVE